MLFFDELFPPSLFRQNLRSEQDGIVRNYVVIHPKSQAIFLKKLWSEVIFSVDIFLKKTIAVELSFYNRRTLA